MTADWLLVIAPLLAAGWLIFRDRRPARPARDVGTFDALVADATASDYDDPATPILNAASKRQAARLRAELDDDAAVGKWLGGAR